MKQKSLGKETLWFTQLLISLCDGIYSGVDFHNVVYDKERDSIAVRMTVYIRPWVQLWRTIPLQFFTLLELEDVIVVSVVSTRTKNSWANLALVMFDRLIQMLCAMVNELLLQRSINSNRGLCWWLVMQFRMGKRWRRSECNEIISSGRRYCSQFQSWARFTTQSRFGSCWATRSLFLLSSFCGCSLFCGPA